MKHFIHEAQHSDRIRKVPSWMLTPPPPHAKWKLFMNTWTSNLDIRFGEGGPPSPTSTSNESFSWMENLDIQSGLQLRQGWFALPPLQKSLDLNFPLWVGHMPDETLHVYHLTLVSMILQFGLKLLSTIVAISWLWPVSNYFESASRPALTFRLWMRPLLRFKDIYVFWMIGKVTNSMITKCSNSVCINRRNKKKSNQKLCKLRSFSWRGIN